MSNVNEQTLLDYCCNHINEIADYTQKSYSWEYTYNLEILCQSAKFNKIRDSLPKQISREQIISVLDQKKFYTAYILIMLWGGIGQRPSTNKDKRSEIAKSAFNHSKDIIESIFINVINALNSDNLDAIKTEYNSLEPGGDKKIPEVDVSFFTKILSFASQVADKRKIDLLIYDKWTKLVHIHYMLDNNFNPAELYTPKMIGNLILEYEKGKYSTNLIQSRTGKGWDSYLHYCESMKTLANQVTNNTNVNITPFQLEGFLFGRELRGKQGKNEDNPRYWIQQNYCKKTKNI